VQAIVLNLLAILQHYPGRIFDRKCNSRGSCLTKLLDTSFPTECDGRSCQTDVLDVSPSVSDRVFVAASFLSTDRCHAGAVTFALDAVDTVPGSRRHLSDAVGQADVATPLYPDLVQRAVVPVGVKSLSGGGLSVPVQVPVSRTLPDV